MYGGLLKSASALAIVAAASLYGASPVKAADLGGDCCADLEERVAELEATTVRKGNRKVSLAISGFVSHHVMWWDDGTQQDMYVGDGGNYGSRFRFTGTAKISPQITAGFLYEFGANTNAIGSMNQLNWGDNLGASGVVSGTVNSTNTGLGCNAVSGTGLNTHGCVAMRDTTVWLRHNQLGMVKIGHGSTATDNLTLIDLGGLAGASTSDVALYPGGFMLRGNNGTLASVPGINWAGAIRGHESWDTSRREHVLYETPSIAGFTLQGAVAQDNFWDVALRYAGEFSGFRLAGGIGYQEDTQFNGPGQANGNALAATIGGAGAASVVGQNGTLCDRNCDVKSSEVKGSASILHVPTGLFLTGAAGKRELEGHSFAGAGAVVSGGDASGSYVGPDLRFWYLAGGISQNFFGMGKTVLFGEYSESKGGLAQAAFLGGNGASGASLTAQTHCANSTAVQNCDSTVTHWGIGAVQHIDAAAMEIFVAYKNYSLESNGFLNSATQTNSHLNNSASGVADIQTFIVGTRISF